ncbi:MAG: helix-turn-helix domain-containing protein [Spirochaetales bacterium]|jgi:AraC family L-rhamnose operon transcriptional activator RhaR/AraC family L-rhamnose operon regulatory protein RhaS|nr:helix-turn-helix domain-containing protein [Spirochaetales bacterium]
MSLILRASDYFYDPSFPIKVLDRDPEIPYPLHSHDFWELIVIVSGSGTHFDTAGSFELTSGNVFVIPPGFKHGYRDVRDLRLFNILFDISMFEESFFDLSNMSGYQALLKVEPSYRHDGSLSTLMQLTPAQQARVLPLLEHMLVESDSTESEIGAKAGAFAILAQLLVMLFRIYAEQPRKDNQTVMRIADALSFLEAHPDRSVSTSELMELTNMSASTLNRHFKNATGLSPIEFHIQRRIKHACRLLRSSDMSVSEISEATGFEDSNYFSRQFRNVMGITPLSYRKNRSMWYRLP